MQPDKSHPAHRDLNPLDAQKTLAVHSVAAFDYDMFGRLSLEENFQIPVLDQDRIDSSPVVLMIRSLRISDEPPMTKLARLLALLDACAEKAPVRAPVQDEEQDESEDELNSGNLLSEFPLPGQLHQYELNAFKPALEEVLRQLPDAELPILSALAKGELNRNQGIAFEVLLDLGQTSLKGVNVAEVIIPLLDSSKVHDGVFKYLTKCGKSALPVLGELLEMTRFEEHKPGVVEVIGPNTNALWKTICAIARDAGIEAFPYVENALSSVHQGVKIRGLQLLQRDRLSDAMDDDSVERLIQPLLNCEDLSLKAEAVRTLGELGKRAQKYQARILLIADEAPEELMATCMQAIGKIPGNELRALEAFEKHWDIITETPVTPEQSLDEDDLPTLIAGGMTFQMPRHMLLEFSSAIADGGGYVNEEQGKHLDNLKFFLSGLVALSDREPRATALLEDAWNADSEIVRLRLIMSLSSAKDFSSVEPFYLKALESVELTVPVINSLLSSGGRGLHFLRRFCVRLKGEYEDTKDEKLKAKILQQMNHMKFALRREEGES